MKTNSEGIATLLMDLAMRQTSVTQLFSEELLRSIGDNLGLNKTVIMCFDQNNTFLSWTDKDGVHQADNSHPYVDFAQNDVVEHVVYYTSRRENLTYFNMVPKLYRSTDIINPIDYEGSAYVRFFEEQFDAHYSVTMAFGIYGYIQVLFLKGKEEGDFTREELLELENLYVIIAGAYVNFKRHEQAQIISSLKDRVIAAEQRDYFITDGFNHVLMASPGAREKLGSLFGMDGGEDPDPQEAQMWIPMVLKGIGAGDVPGDGAVSQVGGQTFRVFGHEQRYDHGIVEEYYLVTISEEGISSSDDKTGADSEGDLPEGSLSVLTPAEKRIAELLDEGYTYKQIAAELVISYHTVKKHVENIYSKLGISSRYQLYELMK